MNCELYFRVSLHVGWKIQDSLSCFHTIEYCHRLNLQSCISCKYSLLSIVTWQIFFTCVRDNYYLDSFQSYNWNIYSYIVNLCRYYLSDRSSTIHMSHLHDWISVIPLSHGTILFPHDYRHDLMEPTWLAHDFRHVVFDRNPQGSPTTTVES